MPWEYSQSKGELRLNGGIFAKGYSGVGQGLNESSMENVPFLGPIPCGEWQIGDPYDSDNTGPFSVKLIPVGHNAHNRKEFLIHGDITDGPRFSASQGCIILSPEGIRKDIHSYIQRTGDRKLIVVK